MCASAIQTQRAKNFFRDLGLPLPADWDFGDKATFPLGLMAFVRQPGEKLEAAQGQFGLVPDWVGDDKGGPKYGRYCYNARTESVFEKPSFRQAILRRRAVVPVDAFYEFPDKETPLRRRFKVSRKDGAPLLMAALWERNEKYKLESVSVLTSEPLACLAPFHSRSPILLEPQQVQAWLDPLMKDAAPIGSYFKVADSAPLVLDEEAWGKPDPNLDLFNN